MLFKVQMAERNCKQNGPQPRDNNLCPKHTLFSLSLSLQPHSSGDKLVVRFFKRPFSLPFRLLDLLLLFLLLALQLPSRGLASVLSPLLHPSGLASQSPSPCLPLPFFLLSPLETVVKIADGRLSAFFPLIFTSQSPSNSNAPRSFSTSDSWLLGCVLLLGVML